MTFAAATRSICAAALVAVISACASTGAQIDQAKVDAIKPGVTTYADLVRDFGAPLSQSFNPQGLLQTQWFYFYTGAFGIGQEQQTLTVLFDKNRVVQDVVSSSSAGQGTRFGR